jgi:hypothetical protein
MRKVVLGILSFMVVLMVTLSDAGCTGKNSSGADSATKDYVALDTAQTDSAENLIASTPMPKAADELFDDFIFNFAANKRLQRKRVHFPLPVYKNGKQVGTMDLHNWKMEHFFMRQDYYTLIFDNRKQMKLVKDTTVSNVVVEKIYFKTKTVKQYLFNRINGQWMLTSINYKPMYQNLNASFLKFYQRFAVDSAFQVQSMNSSVIFTGPDPDNDFGTITGEISPDQWPSFKPAFLPHGLIYNIIYGQKYTEGNQKIFVIQGIANGLETQMTFRRKGNRWKLVSFSY